MTDSATSVIWEEPPGPSRRNRLEWLPLLEALVERPTQWARLREYRTNGAASSTADRLKHGIYHVPPGRFEFATRTLEPGRVALYGRYLGSANGRATTVDQP